MTERGVRERVNTSEAYIWEDAVQYAVYPLAQGYNDSQVGDFVRLTDDGRIARSPSGQALENYRGIIVGIAPDSGEYPAFGGHLTDRPLVALLSPNKTELIMRQMDGNNGEYVAPTLRAGQPVRFIYHSGARRWGVRLAGTGETPTGRVAEVLSDGRLLIVFGG